MAKRGFEVFDSDMHVYDGADLYETYMNPKWGKRIPRGRRNGEYGRVEFSIGGGRIIAQAFAAGQVKIAIMAGPGNESARLFS